MINQSNVALNIKNIKHTYLKVLNQYLEKYTRANSNKNHAIILK